MPPILVPSSAKRIATRILKTTKIKWKIRSCFKKLCFQYDPSQQTITCLKLATETQEQGVKTVQD